MCSILSRRHIKKDMPNNVQSVRKLFNFNHTVTKTKGLCSFGDICKYSHYLYKAGLMKSTLLHLSILSAIMLLSGCTSGTTKSDYPYNGTWTLVFEDTFDSSIDNGTWKIAEQGLNWNNENQAYILNNAAVENGNLILTAKHESWTGLSERVDNPSAEVTQEYTSGELNSNLSWTYGRFEARIKVPRTKGVLSAFWMTPVDRSWPPEIDIMEILGSNTSRVYFTNHYGTPTLHQMNSGNYSGGSDFADAFHVYAVEWEPDAIRWYVDGKLVFTSTAGIPDAPAILRFSLPIGPDWEGDPDSTSVFPQKLEIDYVRVYQKR